VIFPKGKPPEILSRASDPRITAFSSSEGGVAQVRTTVGWRPSIRRSKSILRPTVMDVRSPNTQVLAGQMRRMEHPPCSVVPACNLAVLSRLPTGNPTKECAMIGGPPALGDKLQRIINVDCSNLRLTQEAKQKIIPRSYRSVRRMPGYLRTRGE
jgi:hypothetical protein